ncbi:MAG: 1-deoxy-D-xylulose-5-phosphate synthase N-terminal domain-containing protein [Thermoplasmata archaeon]
MTSFQDLSKITLDLKKELIVKHNKTKMAHIGSDLSCLNVLVTLYMKVLGKEDKFILSKGHAALALYAVLHRAGIMSDKVYSTLGHSGSLLGEHPLYGIKGVEFATGSLGHGLALAAGMALGKKLNGEKGVVYILLSDGECQEGSTLEAMNFIARQKLDNIVCIIDSNKWEAYDRTLLPIDKVKKEFLSAGWKDIKQVDGRRFDQLYDALINSKKNGPRLIISNSVLAMGVKQMEDQLKWHYLPPTDEQAKQFLAEFDKR